MPALDHRQQELREELSQQQSQLKKTSSSPFANLPMNTKLIIGMIILYILWKFVISEEQRMLFAIIGGVAILFVFMMGSSTQPYSRQLSDQQLIQRLYDQLHFKMTTTFSNGTSQLPQGRILIDPVCSMHRIDGKAVGKKIAFRIIDRNKMQHFFYSILDLFSGDILDTIRLYREYDPNRDYPSIKTVSLQDIQKYNSAMRATHGR